MSNLFQWNVLGLSILHKHLGADEELTKYFIKMFGKQLTRQQLSDAFMSGYYFYSKIHNVSIKNFEDLDRLKVCIQ